MTAQLRAFLDEIEEASCCSGTFAPTERIAIALPDGDVGAVDDPGFVEWLVAHAEPAPFGDGTETRVDAKVRAAHRLVARGAAQIHGFDPSAILGEIEATLSPDAHLDAELTDVVIYRKGGKFLRHKDTPRTDNLVGTLVVGLPLAHEGGAFVVDDGRNPQTFDWSGEPNAGAIPWVALFSDVDHEIKPVKSGTRVTLVYSLLRSTRKRTDKAATELKTKLAVACKSIAAPRWPLMIACGRRVIAEPNAPQPQSVDTLRGFDRAIAEALVEAGYRVAARACIAPVPNYNDPEATPFPDVASLFSITRLKSMPPASVIENMDDEGAAQDMEEHILDGIPMEQWLIRRSAAATLVQEAGMWTETGYFGNEGYDALLYTLAALEVTKGRSAPAKVKAAAKVKAKVKANTPAKAKAKAKPPKAAKAKPRATTKSRPKAAKPRAKAKSSKK